MRKYQWSGTDGTDGNGWDRIGNRFNIWSWPKETMLAANDTQDLDANLKDADAPALPGEPVFVLLSEVKSTASKSTGRTELIKGFVAMALITLLLVGFVVLMWKFVSPWRMIPSATILILLAAFVIFRRPVHRAVRTIRFTVMRPRTLKESCVAQILLPHTIAGWKPILRPGSAFMPVIVPWDEKDPQRVRQEAMKKLPPEELKRYEGCSFVFISDPAENP